MGQTEFHTMGRSYVIIRCLSNIASVCLYCNIPGPKHTIVTRRSLIPDGLWQQKGKALGPDHTSTLCAVNNLGSLYGEQGKLAEAEQIFAQALAGYEKTLGPSHTLTLDTVNNLAHRSAEHSEMVPPFV
jgi:hypothetical protein